MSQYLSEAFKRLSVLNEETFTVDSDGLEDFIKFEDEDEIDDSIDVIDMEAETADDLQDSYIGKVILECTVCHSKFYKDVEDVIIENDLANIEEECPFCYTTEGYKVVGQVAPFGEQEDTETEDEDDSLEESFKTLTEGKLLDNVKKVATRVGADAATLVRCFAELGDEIANIGKDGDDYKSTKFYDFMTNVENKAVLKALMSGNEKVMNTCTKEDIEELQQEIEEYNKEKSGELEEGLFNKKDKKEIYTLSAKEDDGTWTPVQSFSTKEDAIKLRDKYQAKQPDVKYMVHTGKKFESLNKSVREGIFSKRKETELTARELKKGDIIVDDDGSKEKVKKVTVDTDGGAEIDLKHGSISAGSKSDYKYKVLRKESLKESFEDVKNAKSILNSWLSSSDTYHCYPAHYAKWLANTDSSVNWEKLAEVAFALGYDVYKTSVGYFADEDYLIVCPGCTPDDYANDLDDKDYWENVLKKDLTKVESLNESVNNVNVETDKDIINVNTDDNGKVTVSTEPKDTESGISEGDEVIEPIEPELQTEINDNVEDGEEIEIDVDEFDEESFDELGEGYLKKVYENVNSFKTSKVSLIKDRLVVEGLINFKSGKTKKTNFIFESKEATKSGKVRFIGENKEIARGRKSFTITGKIENKKFLSESFNYNYGVKGANGKAQRLYGTIKRGK